MKKTLLVKQDINPAEYSSQLAKFRELLRKFHASRGAKLPTIQNQFNLIEVLQTAIIENAWSRLLAFLFG